MSNARIGLALLAYKVKIVNAVIEAGQAGRGLQLSVTETKDLSHTLTLMLQGMELVLEELTGVKP